MTNEQIKSNLQKLFDCKIDFSVVQSGKKSSKVNGLYYPGKQEIVLHNKNFKNDNELTYTAVHELTHHILTTEKGVKTSKSHSGIFWATFYDLLDKAIELGFYSRERSDEVNELVESAKEIQKQIIAQQKRLGEIITKIYKAADKNGDRIEDVIEHDLQMSRGKSKELLQIYQTGAENSDEMSKAINQAKDEKQKQAAQNAADNGKTVEQVKAISKSKAKAVDDDLESPEQLRREKSRLERSIERLNDRLVQVEETLNSMLEGGDYD